MVAARTLGDSGSTTTSPRLGRNIQMHQPTCGSADGQAFLTRFKQLGGP
jgi:hypothetical protein